MLFCSGVPVMRSLFLNCHVNSSWYRALSAFFNLHKQSHHVATL